tara:strand:- start:10403 stop:10750 length:348 start_codon:yes stop_codon:yes gene_type:complete
MTNKGYSQSDLAREIWGVVRDKRGYEVAKNRDRISAYLRGKAVPDPANMKKLADVLGVTPEDLAPEITAGTIDRENPEIALTAVSGHADKTHLVVNKIVPMTTAIKVLGLLDDTP